MDNHQKPPGSGPVIGQPEEPRASGKPAATAPGHSEYAQSQGVPPGYAQGPGVPNWHEQEHGGYAQGPGVPNGHEQEHGEYTQGADVPSGYAQGPSGYAQNPSGYAQGPGAPAGYAQGPGVPSGYAQNPGAPALNPYYTPYKKPVRTPYDFKPGDAVYACFALVLGFLFWEMRPGSSLGGFIVLMAALVGTAIFLHARGIRQTPRSLSVFVVCVLGTLPLLLYNTIPITFLLVVFVLFSCFYWVAVSAGTSVEERLSGFVLTDWANQTFVVPFSNYLGLFLSIKAASKDAKRGRSVLVGIVGLCIAIPLIIGVTSLLIKSDAGFEKFADDFSKWIGLDDIGIYVLELIGGIPIACYIFGSAIGNAQKRYTSAMSKERAAKTLASAHRIPRAAIMTPLAAFCILYIVYIIVMGVYLFSAFADTLPAGLAVYASYARSGFFELCGVAAINLIVLIFTYSFAKREADEYPKALRFLTGLLSVMTELLVLTGVSKMLLYIDAYGLSRLRIFVLWFLVLLIIIFALLIAWHIRPLVKSGGSVRKLNAGKPIVAVTVLMVVLLGLANTDGIIAKYNVQQYEAGKSRAPDTYMLGNMSDATLPYLVRLRDNAPNFGVDLKAREAIKSIGNRHEWDLEDDDKNAFRNWSIQVALTKKYLPEKQWLPEDQSGIVADNYINIRGRLYSKSLTRLDLSNLYLEDESFAFLEQMTELTELRLNSCSISDLTPLAGLKGLTFLTLDYTGTKDLSPLSGLPNLTYLTLRGNAISDLSPLAGLTNLKGLVLTENRIEDLAPLSGLTGLTSLALSSNNISDLAPLAGLTNLNWLLLDRNAIESIDPLAGLANLTDLSLAYNQISDLTPLSGLARLNDLSLTGNQIEDFSPLAGLAGLTWLDLNYNQINDLTPLEGIRGLSYVNLEHNEISDWTPSRSVRNVQGSP